MRAPTSGELVVRPGAVDARLDAETDGRSIVRAALDASSPELGLERGRGGSELGPVRIAADVARDAEALTVSLREIQLGDLLPRATGWLRAHADGTGPALELAGPHARPRAGGARRAPSSWPATSTPCAPPRGSFGPESTLGSADHLQCREPVGGPRRGANSPGPPLSSPRATSPSPTLASP